MSSAMRNREFVEAKRKLAEIGITERGIDDGPFLSGPDRQIVVLALGQFSRIAEELYQLATSKTNVQLREARALIVTLGASEAAALRRLDVAQDLLRSANGVVSSLARSLDEARAEIGFEWEPEEGDR